MIYLEGFIAGMFAALIASTIYILVMFVFPILFPFLLSRVTGSGGAGASFSSGPLLGIAFVAFLVGFYWQSRRRRQHR